ncbi:MAG TPA: M20 aminoacylase family protein [Gammaproteobacteria bacterium]|nr:M20 aminoacylase family protein [Gammaproteobacteria bacterium]
MRTIPQIESYRDELTAWRRDLHAHPELAYEEQRTAGLVAERLGQFGLQVHQGLAKTGVVGTLSNGEGAAVGLRADMDALPLLETNEFAHRSRFAGKMHACGHDGHTVMLLAAARYLAAHRHFKGTIHFIFQPAEEAAGGAKVMLEDGLFERFPVDSVFGMHNWPGVAAGSFAMRAGPMMASLDRFDIRIVGKGAHGALPHQGIDPVLVSAHLVTALQSIVSRNVDPLRSAVVSVTKIHGGDAYNIIPERVELGGGIRCFEPDVRVVVKARLAEIATGVAGAYGARAEVQFGTAYPAVINTPAATNLAVRVAADIVGRECVTADFEPVLTSEDFAFMLEKRPGCYVLIGNGAGEGGCGIHNPGYDFNDQILTLGATYWVRLAEAFLSSHLA